jgi:hypothetical protein
MKEISLKLPELAVGQILDALYQRVEAWNYTADFLETENIVEGRFIEECSDPNEARGIVRYYKEIIQMIENQAVFDRQEKQAVRGG